MFGKLLGETEEEANEMCLRLSYLAECSGTR